jgi:hypothetical protein
LGQWSLGEITSSDNSGSNGNSDFDQPLFC